MHATAVQGGVKLLRQLTLTRGDADVIAAGAPGLLALLNDEGQVTGGGRVLVFAFCFTPSYAHFAEGYPCA